MAVADVSLFGCTVKLLFCCISYKVAAQGGFALLFNHT